MVEPATTTPATTTPPAAGGPERDVLLATKMQIPRPQLWARLDQGLGGPWPATQGLRRLRP
jgi:hypothetical protein